MRANDKPSNYCQPKTTCLNDGHQFLGLRALNVEDMQKAESAKGKGKSTTKRAEDEIVNNTTDASFMVLPRTDNPTTPPGDISTGLSGLDLNSPVVPNAPTKKATPEEVKKWFSNLMNRVWETVPQPEDEAWNEAEEIGVSDDHIYPLPKGKTWKTLGDYAEISRWEYFPFSSTKGKTGPVDPAKGQGKALIKQFVANAAPGAETSRSSGSSGSSSPNIDDTPSKPGKPKPKGGQS
jgi:hypothetical protein